MDAHARVMIDDGAGNVVGAARSRARLVSAASTNATNVKATAGALFSIYALNTNAAIRYLKLYDKATAPVVGTDVPALTVQLAASGPTQVSQGDMAGLGFTNGISFALTVNAVDTDATAVGAGDVIMTLGYA